MATQVRRHKNVRKRLPRASFTALDRIAVRDIGTMVSVELDDGRMEHCFSIERIAHGAPWKRGERIHLLIRKARSRRTNHAGSVGPDGDISVLWIDDA